MSAKNLDLKGRLRNKIVSFRMSPQEAKLLDDYVSVSGLNKQDYIIDRVLRTEITVNPSPRVYKGLRDKLNNVYSELCRIEKGSEISEETLCLICYMSAILREMGG
ncbi:plasmid mobilization protein [uncultured Eubacterium sp.]|mgnify:FL=1|uniref:plasmid mobilization protein n=1 Tax=uncultured Eubacterium sp. TaxID=165185 RepID=UPI0025F970B7|nr:hypothetical protein [uncultured Eubacterium sp.]